MPRAITLHPAPSSGVPALEREILRGAAPRIFPHIRTRLPAPELVVRFPPDAKIRRAVWRSATGHPAMMHCGLLLELVRLYTQPKTRILDPFGGIGTTALAALLDREVILSELEPHFAATARAIIPKLTPDVLALHTPIMDSHLSRLRFMVGALDNPTLEAGLFGTTQTAPVTVHNQDSRTTTPGEFVHTIITSPPYLDTFAHPHSANFMPSTARSYTRELDSPNLARIRNKSIFTRGLAQVLEASTRVLRPDGLAILVTKDPIRQNRRYPFAVLCITIMQALGFFLADWWRRDCIPTLFTNLKRQNNPDVCKVDQEDVLIFSRYSRAVC